METISSTEARANLKEVMDRVCDTRQPIQLTRARDEPVVLMSKRDYDSMQETLYLLSNPANASRLLGAVDRIRRGEATERELLDD